MVRVCSACGVTNDKKKIIGTLCKKHYEQLKRKGRVLDNNPRSINDPNEIIKYEDYAEIVLYNQKSIEIARAKIDLEDVDKCSKHKWRVNTKPSKRKTKLYCYAGSGAGNQIPLHRYIMNCPEDYIVDHINSDALDCRKSNMRVCKERDNLLNKEVRPYSNCDVRGISYDKRQGKYVVDFIMYGNRMFVRPYKLYEEAVYVRYLMETHFLGEFRNTNNDKVIMSYIQKLSQEQKKDIEDYFLQKAQTHPYFSNLLKKNLPNR